MVPVLLQTLPFFALIGLGFGAGRTGFFGPEATAALTKFVFYFALSAMLLRFAASLSFAQIWSPRFVLAYLLASGAVYLAVTAVAWARGTGAAVAAIEAQCAVIGNVGFLGIPLLAILMGPAAVGPTLMVLATDLIVFGSLVVIVVTGSRGRLSPAILGTVGRGLLANPMIVSITLGLALSGAGWTLPAPVDGFLATLGAAATPGALFAIGASLAHLPFDKPVVAGWLTALKLLVHPAAAATACIALDVPAPGAGVMVAAAALPVAGNIYILAAHYGVAPARASAAILVSHVLAVLTVPAWIALLSP
ncbi:MAG: AEC family transporter [Hasllibacter sp.]